MRDETKEQLWTKLREAWAEAYAHAERFRNCVWLLQEIEWALRRFADPALTKDALVELLRQSRFHGPHYDGSRDRPVWGGVEAWADGLEIRSLTDLMNRIDKARYKDDKPPKDGLADAENWLRPFFLDLGETITVYEEVIRHPAYSTLTCVVGLVKEKTKVEVLVRAGSWAVAIEKAEAHAMRMHREQQRVAPSKRPTPHAMFDTDTIRIIETAVVTASSEEPPPQDPPSPEPEPPSPPEES